MRGTVSVTETWREVAMGMKLKRVEANQWRSQRKSDTTRHRERNPLRGNSFPTFELFVMNSCLRYKSGSKALFLRPLLFLAKIVFLDSKIDFYQSRIFRQARLLINDYMTVFQTKTESTSVSIRSLQT